MGPVPFLQQRLALHAPGKQFGNMGEQGLQKCTGALGWLETGWDDVGSQQLLDRGEQGHMVLPVAAPHGGVVLDVAQDHHVWFEPLDDPAAKPLQLVLGGPCGKSFDHGYALVRLHPDPVPQNRVKGVVLLKRFRDPSLWNQQLTAAVLLQVEPDSRYATGDGRTDVEQIRVALGSGSQNGIGEHDGVGLTPRDLLPERGACFRLVGGARPSRGAAHILVGDHLPPRHLRNSFPPDSLERQNEPLTL